MAVLGPSSKTSLTRKGENCSVQFSHSVVSDSLQPPWTAACQASLSITNSLSSLKLTSIESVMPSNHPILCLPLLLLRNLYAGQEATVRSGHGTTNWFQIRKGVHQGCILSPCLFNLYAEYIMRNAGLYEAQAGIKIAGRKINNLRY